MLRAPQCRREPESPLDVRTRLGKLSVSINPFMSSSKIKKQWKKPELRLVQLCCECTAYSSVSLKRR
jgi:hypothetical protein